MKKIALVTINFNSEEKTHNCLTSLRNVTKKDFLLDIIVVDNASKIPFVLTDQEKEDKIHLIRSEKNLGFTGGNNLGMRYALTHGYDYVMLLNNDTLVDRDLVANLLKVAQENPQYGLIVPKIYFAKGHEFHKDRYTKQDEGKVLWYAGGGIDWANIFSFHRGVDEVDHGQYDKEEEVGFATGCCMFLPSHVLKEVGLFDDKFFLYFEDGDLTQRIKRAKYKVMYVPSGYLWHINAGSSGGSGSALHDYYITRNRMIFGMRYAPVRSKIALLRESLRILLKGRPWQKKGIRDFYLQKLGKGSYV